MEKRDRKAPAPAEVYTTLSRLFPSLESVDRSLSSGAMTTAYIYIEGDTSTEAVAATVSRIDVQLRRSYTVLSRSLRDAPPPSGFYPAASPAVGLTEEAFIFGSYAGRHRAGGSPGRRQVGQVGLWLLTAALAGHVGNRADVVLWEVEQEVFEHRESTPPPLPADAKPTRIDIDLTLPQVRRLRDIEPDGASREGLPATVVVFVDDPATGRSVVVRFKSAPKR